MPIGPITPGSPVTVTPDTPTSLISSIQAPTATMPVKGSDVQALTLDLLNVQHALGLRDGNWCLNSTASAAGKLTEAEPPTSWQGWNTLAYPTDLTGIDGDLNLTIGGCQIGDLITWELCTTVRVTSSDATMPKTWFRMGYQENGGAFSLFPGCYFRGETTDDYRPLNMTGSWTVAVAGTVVLGPFARVTDITHYQLFVAGTYRLYAKLFRANPAPP